MSQENTEEELLEQYRNLMDKLDFGMSKRCPTCMLYGKPRVCPKCQRKVCTSCLAVDNTDCIACGPSGEIFLELKARMGFANGSQDTVFKYDEG